jgi:transposase-like protein
VKDIVSNLGIEELSASSVSNIAKELDEKVNPFFNRPIEKEIRYLFIDATYFKIRKQGRYVNHAVFVAIGVDTDGYRTVIGTKIAESESESFWIDFFNELKDRGLRGIKLVISDGHRGIINAVEKSFSGSSWQMCHTHFMRMITRKTPKKKWERVTNKVKDLLDKPYEFKDEIKLQESIEKLIEELEKAGFSKAARTVEIYRYNLFNYKAFPQSHWRRIKTTNMLERLNKELKRRGRVVGAFPNTNSLMRLMGTILMNQDEEWVTGRRYLTMEDEIVRETTEDPKEEMSV